MAFKQHPNHITSFAMANLSDSLAEINGKWQPSRPVSYPSLFDRFKYAWWVLIGKGDVLTWPNQ